MKPRILSSCLILLAVAACQQIASTARAASAFTVTPPAVSNLYAGTITLQINGLSTGETVQIDKFLDANGSGVIDAADLLVQSFLLTDGQASVIDGVTNINIPGDFNPINGVITAQLRIAGDITQQIVAQYLFRLSSPISGFTPMTIPFSVTNSAYAQSFTGAVRNSGTNVPNAVVMVSPGTGQGDRPFAGVMADSSGSYTLNLPGGTYLFWLFKSNFVANLSQAPVLTLTNGATFTTNLHFLIPATTSISGQIVDAANTNTGLPAVFMMCQSADRQLLAGACYTASDGAFAVPVIAGQWGVSVDSEGLAAYGYVDLQDHPRVDTSTGSVSGVTLALPKATALFYGSVLDSQSHPFAGMAISCYDNNGQYEADCITDANGYFVAGLVGGLSNDGWKAEVSNDTAPANYIFSRPSFDQSGGTNINAGQAVPVNFTALLAANRISGNVTNGANQQPVANVGVYAYAPNIDGLNYSQYAITDPSGHYAFSAANGSWYVGLNCNGGDDSLERHGFECVSDQGTNIVNNNVVVNFTVQPLVPPGPDLVSYYVVKLEAFLQVDPANFVLNTNFGPFNAYLGLVQSISGVVPIANVTLPNGSARALPWGSSGLELRAQESFPDQASIDAAYPPGDYTFGLYALNDGLQFPVLSMPPAAYPNPPHVSNFAAAQSINPLSPFTLQWDSIPGATTNDSLWVLVTDTVGNAVFSTPQPSLDRAAALPGTATSVVIPTNTLQPGNAYLGWITFFHTTGVNMTEYPGAAGVTLVAAQTSVPLSINSGAPRLDQSARLSDTQFRFQLSGMTGQNFTVQVSTNLASTNWFTLLTTNLSASPVFIQDYQATNQQRFYRVKLGP